MMLPWEDGETFHGKTIIPATPSVVTETAMLVEERKGVFERHSIPGVIDEMKLLLRGSGCGLGT